MKSLVIAAGLVLGSVSAFAQAIPANVAPPSNPRPGDNRWCNRPETAAAIVNSYNGIISNKMQVVLWQGNAGMASALRGNMMARVTSLSAGDGVSVSYWHTCRGWVRFRSGLEQYMDFTTDDSGDVQSATPLAQR